VNLVDLAEIHQKPFVQCSHNKRACCNLSITSHLQSRAPGTNKPTAEDRLEAWWTRSWTWLSREHFRWCGQTVYCTK